jgi:hypothetical protein
MKHPSRTLILVGMCLVLSTSGIANQDLAYEGVAAPGEGGNLVWSGRPGRTYFVMASENLHRWIYLKAIHAGSGATLTMPVLSDGAALFFRLRFTDLPSSNPGGDDFDGDGVSNADELENSTDPFNPDSDGDGIPDGDDSNPLVPFTGGGAASSGPRVLSSLE